MIRVTTQMTGLAGAPYYSTAYSLGNDAAAGEELADAVRVFWDGLKGLITAGLTIQVLGEVDEVDPATGNITETFGTVQTPVVSTGNAPLPKATQALLRLRTSTFVAGRRIQGRTFVPALANDAQVGGVPSAALITALNASFNTAQGLLGVDNEWCVYSRTHALAAAVTSWSPWTQFAVLRSRRD